MKKLLIITLAFAMTVISCEKKPKDYASFSGKVTNKNSDSLLIQSRNYKKTIKLNEDGTFSDTLKVEAGVFSIFDGKDFAHLFLENGIELVMTVDASDFNKTALFTGERSETSNYLAKKNTLIRSSLTPALLDLEEDAFKAKVTEIQSSFYELLENTKNIDSIVYADEKESFSQLEKGLMAGYKQQQALKNQFEKFKGKPSPPFKNYENFKGGSTSLSDLKGKYVYIDVWATWCGPCIREIPSLKEIENKYHGKNIEFVSISVDNGRGFSGATQEEKFAASKEAWKKMITDKDMGGTQLFSDNAWDSDFVRGFEIRGIPRFILLDPKGNVVDANAPRPSDPKLIKLFNELNI